MFIDVFVSYNHKPLCISDMYQFIMNTFFCVLYAYKSYIHLSIYTFAEHYVSLISFYIYISQLNLDSSLVAFLSLQFRRGAAWQTLFLLCVLAYCSNGM